MFSLSSSLTDVESDIVFFALEENRFFRLEYQSQHSGFQLTDSSPHKGESLRSTGPGGPKT